MAQSVITSMQVHNNNNDHNHDCDHRAVSFGCRKFRVCFGFALLRSVIYWLTKLAPLEWESKPKPIVFSLHAFSHAWRKLHVFASNSDWLVVFFTSVAIDQSNYFLRHSIGNRFKQAYDDYDDDEKDN